MPTWHSLHLVSKRASLIEGPCSACTELAFRKNSRPHLPGIVGKVHENTGSRNTSKTNTYIVLLNKWPSDNPDLINPCRKYLSLSPGRRDRLALAFKHRMAKAPGWVCFSGGHPPQMGVLFPVGVPRIETGVPSKHTHTQTNTQAHTLLRNCVLWGNAGPQQGSLNN